MPNFGPISKAFPGGISSRLYLIWNWLTGTFFPKTSKIFHETPASIVMLSAFDFFIAFITLTSQYLWSSFSYMIIIYFPEFSRRQHNLN